MASFAAPSLCWCERNSWAGTGEGDSITTQSAAKETLSTWSGESCGSPSSSSSSGASYESLLQDLSLVTNEALKVPVNSLSTEIDPCDGSKSSRESQHLSDNSSSQSNDPSSQGSSSSDASLSSSCASSSEDSSCSSFDIGLAGDLEENLSAFLSATSGQRSRLVAGVASPKRQERPAVGADCDSGIDPLNEEQLSAIRDDLMKIGNMFASQQCAGFRERSHVLASINYCSRNVPSCVLDHLGREVKSNQNKKLPVDQDDRSLSSDDRDGSSDSECDSDVSISLDVSASPSHSCQQGSETTFYSASFQEGVILGLPYVAPFRGAVLFGYTSLSARVGSENISRLLNKYFETLISEVFLFGGDIQKFSGDAFFAEWRVLPNRPPSDCVKLAALCTCKLTRDFENYPIEITDDTGACVEVVQMNSYFGLGFGAMTGIHIGDSEYRRQYLHIGDPIVQATSACNLADRNEVVVSPEFYEMALKIGLQPSVFFERRQNKISLKASDKMFDHCLEQTNKGGGGNSRSRAITEHVEGLELDLLREYQRLISLYCHPVAKEENKSLHATSTMGVKYKQSDSDEAEMRDVFVAFLNAPVSLHKNSNGAVDSKTVHKINRVFNLVSYELLHCKGNLEAFIDDKGFSLMITFGLRGSWFPKLVSSVALPAVQIVGEVLALEENIRCQIGATYGNVHCGFLGSKQRHEYTVLGPSVNLAARLMTAELNEGLLVDQSVRDSCEKTHPFQPIGHMTAKGFSHQIMTYKPIATDFLQKRCLRANNSFVGRRKELDFIAQCASSSRSTLVLIEGTYGIGKTALLLEASSIIAEKTNGYNCVHCEHIVGEPRMSSVPFGAIRGFLQSIVNYPKPQLGRNGG